MVTGGNLELKIENNEWVSDPKEPNRKAYKLGIVQKLKRSRPWWFRPVILATRVQLRSFTCPRSAWATGVLVHAWQFRGTLTPNKN